MVLPTLPAPVRQGTGRVTRRKVQEFAAWRGRYLNQIGEVIAHWERCGCDMCRTAVEEAIAIYDEAKPCR